MVIPLFMAIESQVNGRPPEDRLDIETIRERFSDGLLEVPRRIAEFAPQLDAKISSLPSAGTQRGLLPHQQEAYVHNLAVAQTFFKLLTTTVPTGAQLRQTRMSILELEAFKASLRKLVLDSVAPAFREKMGVFLDLHFAGALKDDDRTVERALRDIITATHTDESFFVGIPESQLRVAIFSRGGVSFRSLFGGSTGASTSQSTPRTAPGQSTLETVPPRLVEQILETMRGRKASDQLKMFLNLVGTALEFAPLHSALGRPPHAQDVIRIVILLEEKINKANGSMCHRGDTHIPLMAYFEETLNKIITNITHVGALSAGGRDAEWQRLYAAAVDVNIRAAEERLLSTSAQFEPDTSCEFLHGVPFVEPKAGAKGLIDPVIQRTARRASNAVNDTEDGDIDIGADPELQAVVPRQPRVKILLRKPKTQLHRVAPPIKGSHDIDLVSAQGREGVRVGTFSIVENARRLAVSKRPGMLAEFERGIEGRNKTYFLHQAHELALLIGRSLECMETLQDILAHAHDEGTATPELEAEARAAIAQQENLIDETCLLIEESIENSLVRADAFPSKTLGSSFMQQIIYVFQDNLKRFAAATETVLTPRIAEFLRHLGAQQEKIKARPSSAPNIVLPHVGNLVAPAQAPHAEDVSEEGVPQPADPSISDILRDQGITVSQLRLRLLEVGMQDHPNLFMSDEPEVPAEPEVEFITTLSGYYRELTQARDLARYHRDALEDAAHRDNAVVVGRSLQQTAQALAQATQIYQRITTHVATAAPVEQDAAGHMLSQSTKLLADARTAMESAQRLYSAFETNRAQNNSVVVDASHMASLADAGYSVPEGMSDVPRSIQVTPTPEEAAMGRIQKYDAAAAEAVAEANFDALADDFGFEDTDEKDGLDISHGAEPATPGFTNGVIQDPLDIGSHHLTLSPNNSAPQPNTAQPSTATESADDIPKIGLWKYFAAYARRNPLVTAVTLGLAVVAGGITGNFLAKRFSSDEASVPTVSSVTPTPDEPSTVTPTASPAAQVPATQPSPTTPSNAATTKRVELPDVSSNAQPILFEALKITVDTNATTSVDELLSSQASALFDGLEKLPNFIPGLTGAQGFMHTSHGPILTVNPHQQNDLHAQFPDVTFEKVAANQGLSHTMRSSLEGALLRDPRLAHLDPVTAVAAAREAASQLNAQQLMGLTAEQIAQPANAHLKSQIDTRTDGGIDMKGNVHLVKRGAEIGVDFKAPITQGVLDAGVNKILADNPVPTAEGQKTDGFFKNSVKKVGGFFKGLFGGGK